MDINLTIRTAREGDIKQLMLFEFRNRGWFSQFLSYLPHKKNTDQSLKYGMSKPLVAQQYLVFLSNTVLVGRFSAQFLDNYQETLEITYKISKAFSNRGIAQHVLKHLLVVWASQGVKDVYAHVADHNAASKQVLMACGFTLFERQSQAINVNNHIHDYLVYLWSVDERLYSNTSST